MNFKDFLRSEKITYILTTIINWTWCLPQNLAALALRLFLFHFEDGCRLDNVTYFFTDLEVGSVSLGRYVFLCESHHENKRVQKHEYGHVIQSYILGPLYLPVIALPSLLWACTYKLFKKDYYWFYTEKWANKLAGLE